MYPEVRNDLKLKQLWSEGTKMIGQMHASGVPFLAVTDALAMPIELPGFILHDELQLLVKAGLKPLAASAADPRWHLATKALVKCPLSILKGYTKGIQSVVE